MSIYPRLLGIDPLLSKLPVDIFSSYMGEFQRGKLTQAQMATYFALDASENTELTTLLGRVTPTGGGGKLSSQEFREILELAEYPQQPTDDTHQLGVNNPYGTVAQLKARLGV
jgi:hypothetical protein